MIMTEIPTNYNSQEEEHKIQTFWEKNGVFTFNPDTIKPIFSIDTPPPTLSGKMHVGHAASFTQQDIIARYKRMKGFEVFYPFGTDDNGLPTIKLVQKEKKLNLHALSREEEITHCKDYVETELPRFIQDWKDIGMSCDFNITYSTIDDNSRRIAQKTFLDLAKQNRVYQKEAPILWDTKFQSAIAQAELEDIEKTTLFNDIVFQTQNGEELVIATTRPELLGACVAIFAHPDDKRYQHLFGKHALSPLYNAKVPILPDEKADPQKGTGIVMCCTFGDQTDIEWYKKHNLPLIMVINPDGKMNERAGKYVGLKIDDARKQIIEDLKKANLLKNQKEISHTVNVGERSGVAVEIIHSKQWYVKYLDKREDFLQSSEKLNWNPHFMKHRLDNWIKGLNWDWSISRQRSYGIPIPVWYDETGKIYYADETQLPVDPTKDRPLSAPEGVTLIPETDVFDTWFTSASTPFLATDSFKDKPVYKKLFPMSMRPQAHDIINFWLFYTMAKTRLLHGVNPWEDAIISGFVLDPKGNKMAKSKGNVVSPQVMIQKHSADALRFWAGSTKLGEDSPFLEAELLNAKKLLNKLWNATKFSHLHLTDFTGKKPLEFEILDQWIIAKTNTLIDKTTQSLENYEYAKAKYDIERFFWHDFCDNYLEIVKDRLYKPEIYGESARKSGQYTIHFVCTTLIKLFAPFIPYITEKLYQIFFKEERSSVHLCDWPIPLDVNFGNDIMQKGDIVVEYIARVRRQKSDDAKSLKTAIKSLTVHTNDEYKSIFINARMDIIGTTKTEKFDVKIHTEDDSITKSGFLWTGESLKYIEEEK